MKENLFRFFRGTCHLFYEDLAKSVLPGSPVGWICGDLHLENFGSYRSANNQVYFDLNDFDEAVLAPLTWEITRMVSSIFVGFRSLDIPVEKAMKMVNLFLKSYTNTLKKGKPDYIEPATAQGIIKKFLESVDKRKHADVLNKRTFLSRNRLKLLVDIPKHFKIKDDLRQQLIEHINLWLKNDENSPYNYKVVDVIFRLAGTGSVGVNRYAFLLKSLNKTGAKHFLLDMKEATASSLLPYLSIQQPQWPTEADRIIAVQKKMQNRCPDLLSTCTFNNTSFIMEEMQPAKDKINFKLLKNQYREMYTVIDSMAILTASSQLRSSGQQGSAITDELIAFGHNENWQKHIIEYSRHSANEFEKYYREFCEGFSQFHQARRQPEELSI